MLDARSVPDIPKAFVLGSTLLDGAAFNALWHGRATSTTRSPYPQGLLRLCALAGRWATTISHQTLMTPFRMCLAVMMRDALFFARSYPLVVALGVLPGGVDLRPKAAAHPTGKSTQRHELVVLIFSARLGGAQWQTPRRMHPVQLRRKLVI
jgi:hypothetical protein